MLFLLLPLKPVILHGFIKKYRKIFDDFNGKILTDNDDDTDDDGDTAMNM